MIGIHGFEAKRHGQFKLDAIAILPGAPDGGKGSGLYRPETRLPLTESTGIGRSPAGNADIDRELRRAASAETLI